MTGFFGKNLVKKRYELSLFRGTLDVGVKDKVDDYVGVPEVSSITPGRYDENVAVATDIDVVFNIDMDATTTEAAISIAPVVTLQYSWTDKKNLKIQRTGDADWDYNTNYTLTIGTGAKADATTYTLKDAYSAEFTTEP